MPAPSVQSIVRSGLRYFYGELQFRDFSGGINIRDAAPELAANESPDLWNITLDERGAIGKRLGYTKYNAAPLYAAFGRTTVAGSGLLLAADQKIVGKFTASFSENITDVWAYIDGTGPGTGSQVLKAVIYGGDPVSPTSPLLKASTEVTVTSGQAAGWVRFPLTSALAVTNGTVYNLGIISGATSNVAHLYRDTTGGVSNSNADTYSDGPADPFGNPSSNIFSISIYAGRSTDLTSAGDYWASGGNQITQAGPNLYKDTSTIPFKTFTTSDTCAMADFKGKLIIVHPIDGLFSYDGTTVTTLGAGPKGNSVITWQNKLWVSGDPNAKSRVYFSAAGDETSWPGTNFVDLREKDQEAVTALAGASGVDVSGRPGMLAAKRRSLYRIYDSSTGAFQTLDTEIGCASPQSFTNGFQRTVFLSEKGIYWTDGVGPLRPSSDKLAPLFDPLMVNFTKLDLWRAGSRGDRMYFSLCRAGSTANDLELEYHPVQGWIVANSCAASFYTTYRANDEKLYAGSPTVAGQVYQRFNGGSDDGTSITSRWQQRWVEPSSGHPARIGRVRVAGRGLFTAELFKDYQQTASESFVVDLRGSAAVYDDAAAVYDTAGVLYGPVNFQDTEDYAMNEVVKAFSLRFSETSSGTSAGLQILGVGTTPTIGSWGAYGIFYTYRPLGLG